MVYKPEQLALCKLVDDLTLTKNSTTEVTFSIGFCNCIFHHINVAENHKSSKNYRIDCILANLCHLCGICFVTPYQIHY